jgi:serine/threonine-protein kinase
VERRAVWANRYAIFDEVASGGMATVYLAGRIGQVSGRRVVAVKKLFEQFAKQPEFVAMFLDEARLAARVRHPNVIRTYQVLRIPDSLAIVMEFVVGVSFAEMLKRARKLKTEPPLLVTGAVIARALRGLHAAHEACDETGVPFGLVHRDVSPHNILIGKDGVPRVIDFGIAKAAGRIQVTEAGVMKGKYAFMAPEQIRGGMIDRRTDVYAAGIVLWEALTGQRLFGGSSDLELLGKRASGEVLPGPPSLLNPGVPQSVDGVVLRALEIDPARRFGTADEMASAIEATLGSASSTDVARWVDRLADDRIAEMDAKVREVERAFDAGELDDISDVSRSQHPSEQPSRPAVLFEMPDLDYALPAPTSAPPQAFSSRPPRGPASGAPLPLPRAPEPPPTPFVDTEMDLEVVRSVPGPSRVGSIKVRRRRVTEPAWRTWLRRLWTAAGNLHVFESDVSRRGLLVLGAVIVVAGAVSLEKSALLESLAVHGAAQRGLSLSAERVTLGGGGLSLSGASVRFVESGDVTLRAPRIDVVLGWLGTVEKVVVPRYDLTVRGSAADIADRFAKWRAEPHPPVEAEARSGHVLWSDAVLPGVSLEADGVSLTMGVEDEPRLHLETQSLTASVADARLGPWPARLDSAPAETRLVVHLDSARADGPPSVTVLARPTLGRIFSVTIPRSKVARLGVPPAFLHVGSDPEVDLVLEGQVFPTGEPVNARAKLALYGVTIPALADASLVTDVSIEGKIGGRPADLIAITEGVVTVQDESSPVKGSVTLDRTGIRIEIDRPRAAASAPPLLVFDTRALTRPPASPSK